MSIESIRKDVEVALRQDAEYKLKIEQLELMYNSWTLEDFCMNLTNPIECSIDTLVSGKTVVGAIKLSDCYPWFDPVKIEASSLNTTIVIKEHIIEDPVNLTEVELIPDPQISLTNPTIVFKKGTPLDNHMVNVFQSTINTIRSTLMLELAKKRIDRTLDRVINQVVKRIKI